MIRTSTTRSIAVVGVDGHVVDVEADISPGIPGLAIVGLPDTALAQARDRVRAAIRNSGLEWPQARMTLNLTPAALPKRGAGFDLACAAALLLAGGLPVRADRLHGVVLIGELGLDGRVRPVPGVLAAALAAARAGIGRIVVPRANAPEARLVEGLAVTGVASLGELVAHLQGQQVPEDVDPTPPEPLEPRPAPDLADVLGQATARWACEVAAAGGHHMLLKGPPGAGKTMLAERLPGLLPPLSRAESLEVSAVHSVAGRLPGGQLLTAPPFVAAHHTASAAAMVGGGSGVIRPGLVSLAHRGVLFLDEAPEFARHVLEVLRQPLTDGTVTVARVMGPQSFPARFQLVLAANPCPCAAADDAVTECTCGPAARRRYLDKLSGPLMDRVDITITVRAVSTRDLAGADRAPESSAVVAERVQQARARAAHRLAGTPWTRMSELPSGELRGRFALDPRHLRPVYAHLDRGLLTARGVDRVVRVAWTIADLRGLERPGSDELEEALGLRGLPKRRLVA